MKKLMLLCLLGLIPLTSYADKPTQDVVKDAHYYQTTHYSIVHKDSLSTFPKFAAPCRYSTVVAKLECYETENIAIKAFFKKVPAKLKAKGASQKRIAAFKREQVAFERRVKRYCDRQARLEYSQAQGSGMGMLHQSCFYHRYHPRFVKLKRMLGEPHPVKRRQQ